MNAPGYVKVELERVSFYQNNFILLLKRPGDDNILPICIGKAEATSIASAFHRQPFERPLTHDLMKSVFALLDCAVAKVHVNDLKNGTFFARIFLQTQDTIFEVDSRPSDAIALAIRYDAPIFVREDILAENSVSVQQTEPPADAAAGPGETQRLKASGAAESPPDADDAEGGDSVARLKRRLAKALAAEAYEEAAALRDELVRRGAFDSDAPHP